MSSAAYSPHRAGLTPSPRTQWCKSRCRRATGALAVQENSGDPKTALGQGVDMLKGGGGIFKSAAVTVLRQDRRLLTTAEITKYAPDQMLSHTPPQPCTSSPCASLSQHCPAQSTPVYGRWQSSADWVSLLVTTRSGGTQSYLACMTWVVPAMKQDPWSVSMGRLSMSLLLVLTGWRWSAST